MFKKMFFLCLVLSICCLSQAVIAQTTDTALSQTIIYVKNTLDIPSDFTDLDISSTDYGSCKTWDLSWHNLDKKISVRVSSNNTILSYYYTPAASKTYSPYLSPILSKEQYNACLSQATEFLNTILRDNESFYFYNLPKTFSTNSNNPSFSGVIKINDVDSIFNFYIAVDLQSSKVVSFYRDEFIGLYNEPIPSNTPNVDSDYAKSVFFNEFPVKNLEYVLNPNDPNDHVAKLVYTIPNYPQYYVNANNGQLSRFSNGNPLSINFLEDVLYLNSKAKTTPEDSLTKIELDAISQITDVLSSTQLDTMLKGQKELGLDKYILSKNSYSKNSNSKTFFCDLIYTSDDDLESLGLSTSPTNENITITKSITVNAKTGEIISLYTSYPYRNSPPADATYTTDYHIEFLKNMKNNLFSRAKLISSYKNNFEYAQVENNYLFRQNHMTVGVNNYTGLVDTFNQYWIDSISFEKPDTIITPKQATDSLYNNSTVQLYYATEVLSEKDTLLLVYLLKYPFSVGISAKDGSILSYEINHAEPFTYSDITNCYAKEKLLLLGEHGVGFDRSNLFKANTKVTQLDALVLLANSLGSSFDATDISLSDFKCIYDIAYSYNIITPSQKEPLRPVSRCEFVKMLLSSNYNFLTNLKNPRNIFKCNFTDCDDISDELFAYVCVAQGFGLIVGDGNSHFNPKCTITRLDACNILYNFMQFNTTS